MRKIKRFEPLSVMRISAIAYGAMGVVEGAVLGVIISLAPMADPQHQMPRFFGLLFGSFAILFFPILFAIIGAITGAHWAL